MSDPKMETPIFVRATGAGHAFGEAVKAALRFRPEKGIVAEVADSNALLALQKMNTRHPGTTGQD